MLAAQTTDRTLQGAAVAAVMAIDPRDPFTGTGAVSETLRFLATGRGDRRAVVGHPQLDEGRNLGAWLAARGYQPTIVATGAEAYQAAVASADVELVLVHEALADPAHCDVIRQLRRDRRTATVPTGLLWLPRHKHRRSTASSAIPIAWPAPSRWKSPTCSTAFSNAC